MCLRLHPVSGIQGNEHITRTLPDGREVRTINGIEQHRNEYAPPIEPKSRRANESSGHRYLPPAPVHAQPMLSTSRMDYAHTPPPSYAPRSPTFRDTPRKCLYAL